MSEIVIKFDSEIEDSLWLDFHDPFIENTWPFECDPKDEFLGQGTLFDVEAFMFKCKKNGKYYCFQLYPDIMCVYSDEDGDAVFCDIGPETKKRIQELKDTYSPRVKLNND
jgi:hypothetical protein